ncbi:hypothetical protein NX059_010617 [Plenodomus lindquistii]|nr:hypothetical protein NX059_010617 [Plenodomus lindquistii]
MDDCELVVDMTTTIIYKRWVKDSVNPPAKTFPQLLIHEQLSKTSVYHTQPYQLCLFHWTIYHPHTYHIVTESDMNLDIKQMATQLVGSDFICSNDQEHLFAIDDHHQGCLTPDLVLIDGDGDPKPDPEPPAAPP